MFVLTYITFPLVIFLAYRKLGLSFREVSITNAVVVSLLIFSYVGILPLYFHWDDYRYDIGVVDRAVILSMFLSSCWAIFSITLVFWVLRSVAPVPNRRIPTLYNLRPLNHSEVILSSITFIGCAGVFLSYINSVSNVALFVAIFGGDQSVAAARSAMTNAYGGNYHWYRFFINDIAIFISYCFYANYLMRRNIVSNLIFWSSFFASCVFLLASAQKGPLIWYFFGLYLVYSIVLNEGRVKLKGAFFLTLFGFLALVILYMMFMGVDGFFSAIKLIFSRAFAAGISASYFYFEFFPDHKDYLLGASLPNPAGIFPFEPYQLTKELMAWRFPQDAERGVVGSSPTVFWGEAYANFSWLGIFFVPILIGMIIYLYHFFAYYLENTPIKVGLIAWLIIFFRYVASTGFTSFLINITFFSFLIFVVLLVFISNRLRLKIVL